MNTSEKAGLVGRHCLLVLLVSPAAGLHIMPLPHQSAHMLRRAEHNGHHHQHQPAAWTMNGGGGVILLEWIREEHSLNHLKVCLLSIRQWRRLQACNIGDVFRAEIYLSGRMRTVLLKWQYEP